MRTAIRLMTLAAGILAFNVANAQAPAGATGQCKDGTYTTNATKSGACSGHKGVNDWYAASTAKSDKSAAKAEKAAAKDKSATPAAAPASAPAAAPSTAAAPASTPTTKSTAKSTRAATNTTPAPGGGPGLVWLNTATNVYHCSGARYYGTTKAGAYMTEAAAQAKGAHGEGGKTCK